MKRFFVCLLVFFGLFSCQNNRAHHRLQFSDNHKISPKHAKGFYAYAYPDFTILTITQPWKNAQQTFSYVLTKNPENLADSLQSLPIIQIPLKKIVVTSTTHIPSLEMLGVEETLIGFPETDYISSPKTRARIEAGKVTNLGKNEHINSEVLLSLQPDAVIGFSIDQNNKAYQNFEAAGIAVIYNGDWTEMSPLGRAEWLKFFGYLFDKSAEANQLYDTIQTAYFKAAVLAQSVSDKPTVISGSLFKDVWYLPAGDSWAARFFEDAGGHYLWKDTPGTGSLSLSIENVLEKAHDVDFWIGVDGFDTVESLKKANIHYQKFAAFQHGNVFTFTTSKDSKGGNLYYELAPNRPDWVLQDLIHILHPDILPNHENVFFKKLH
ncbi:MAG: ABC transporter substrate-binding protein [Bacteroidetes bacterium]|nr:ABC transporter substrate-binding protein [Bacteroidota bacterium]